MTEAPARIIDLPLSAAVEELTGLETIAVEAHFKMDFEQLGGIRTLLGTIWVYGNRDGATMSWHQVKALTLRQMKDMFLPEPEDAMESDPDSDVGKEF